MVLSFFFFYPGVQIRRDVVVVLKRALRRMEQPARFAFSSSVYKDVALR